MDKHPETMASAVRLTKPHFAKLRALMRHLGGREWLEELIDDHYKLRLGNRNPATVKARKP